MKRARELWANGRITLPFNVFRRSRDVYLYGGFTPTGPAPAKFGITSRSPAVRWSEYPEQYGSIFVPVFVSQEPAAVHRDLEMAIRQGLAETGDVLHGHEWVGDLRRVYDEIARNDDLLVGMLQQFRPLPKLWRPA